MLVAILTLSGTANIVPTSIVQANSSEIALTKGLIPKGIKFLGFCVVFGKIRKNWLNPRKILEINSKFPRKFEKIKSAKLSSRETLSES